MVIREDDVPSVMRLEESWNVVQDATIGREVDQVRMEQLDRMDQSEPPSRRRIRANCYDEKGWLSR